MVNIVFMFGLPGSGKSTWIENNLPGNIVVSADEIKLNLGGYNPKNPEKVHQESVALARDKAISLAIEGRGFIFDGGGINRKYNKDLINEIRAMRHCVTLIVLDTPLEVCLERNRNRDRQVPEDDIYDKAIAFDKRLAELSKIVDDVKHVKYYTNEHTFVDMDGTIAAYQNMPKCKDGSIDFVNGEFFRFSLPVFPVINKLRMMNSQGSKIYILSASPDNICSQHKLEWLEKHAPFIEKENVYFVGNKAYKNVMLANIMKKLKLNPEDVTMLDDSHAVLDSVKRLGVNSIHPSLFMSL